MENEQNVTAVTTEADWVKKFEDFKSTHVSKEELDAANKKYMELQDAVINGKINASNHTSEQKTKSVNEVGTEFVKMIRQGCTQLDGVKKALELRELALKETGKDPFMNPAMQNFDPSFGQTYTKALEQLVKESDNSDSVFRAKLKDAFSGKPIRD